MLQLLITTLYHINQFIQPALVPLCFVLAWGLVGIVGWSLWAAARDSVRVAQRMHQISCANCQYFTNTHFLKCPVHPSAAGSEEAVNCRDFEARGYAAAANSDHAYR